MMHTIYGFFYQIVIFIVGMTNYSLKFKFIKIILFRLDYMFMIIFYYNLYKCWLINKFVVGHTKPKAPDPI